MKIMVLRRNSRKKLLANSWYCAAFRVWNSPGLVRRQKMEKA
jgi:hypothetical protein